MINKKSQLISMHHTTGGPISRTNSLRKASTMSDKERKSSTSERVSSLGILYMTLSSLSFTFMSFGTKLMYLGSNINPFEGVYLRGLSMVLGNLGYAYYLGLDVFDVPSCISTILWIRTFIGTLGICLNFIANKLLPISISNSLFFLYPLITSCGGYLFLGEKLTKLEIVGMVSSFVGVILVVRYSQQKTETTEAIPLANYIPSLVASFTATGVYLLTRKMGKTVHFLVNPTWFGVVQSLIVTPVWISMRSASADYWHFSSDGTVAVVLMCLGGWLGQVFMNKSLQLEKAGRVAAIGYVQIPLLFLCDAFYFKVPIRWQVVLGTILIIGCSVTVGIMRMLNLIQ